VNVAARTEGRITVLEVSGDIDGKTAPAFQEQVLPRIDPGGRVLLDLSRVGFMSSAGFRTLLLTHREAGSKQARVVLVGLNEGIQTSMSATGFLRYFTVRVSLADGLAALE
jgi:anti-sigma B factor antagonist